MELRECDCPALVTGKSMQSHLDSRFHETRAGSEASREVIFILF